MKHKSTDKSLWNNYWNNHLQFCKVIRTYLIFCYFIKHGNINLFQKLMQEVCIILQVFLANKPKYAQKMSQ